MAITDENCASLSAFRNKPPLTPITPPGAAKAFKESSSINSTVKRLSLTSLYSDSLYVKSSVYSCIKGSDIKGA